MKLITIFFTFITINSCGNSKNTTSLNKQSKQILDGEYSIEKITSSELLFTDLTIRFNDSTKTVSGYSGCNRFTGTYEIKEDNLKIGPLAATKMACPPDRNTIETQFLRALSEINAFEIIDNTLVLKKDHLELIYASKKEHELIITYQAATRGFFEKIWIDKKSINFSNDYNLSAINQVKCSSTDWEELIQLINKIDPSSLPQLEAPSKTNQFDAAPGATLEIQLQGTVYKTAIFDHGNPPKSIEDIVNKVLSMKKLAEKG